VLRLTNPMLKFHGYTVIQLTQGIPQMLEKSKCSALQHDAGVWRSTLNNRSKVTTGECALFHSPSPKFT